MMVLLLHGFGNSPEMFESLRESLARKISGVQFLAPDLYQDLPFDPTQGLQFFGESLSLYLRQHVQSPVWAIGYSMGGRLALQTVMMYPEMFRGAVFLSSSPGVSSEEERQSRLKQDELWADRFRSWNWPELQKAWSELPVFQGSSRKLLREDVAKEKLAQSIVNWSVSRHVFAVDDLKRLEVPTLWLSGELDLAYQKKHAGVPQLSSLAQAYVCKSAGHRLLEDALACTVEYIERFIQEKS